MKDRSYIYPIMINDKIKVMENVVMLNQEVQDKLHDFRFRVIEDLENAFGKLIQGITNEPQYSWGWDKKGEVIQENTGTFAVIQKTGVFELMLHLRGNNTIGLHYLKVYNKGKGMGTNIMNILLDACDDFNFNVELFASSFESEFAKIKYQDLTKKQIEATERANQRLRSWYNSFGFKKSMFSNFIMTYKAS